jgi:hypothetical protein
MKLRVITTKSGELVGFTESERIMAKQDKGGMVEEKDKVYAEVIPDDDQVIEEIDIPDNCKTLDDEKFIKECMQAYRKLYEANRYGSN